VERDKAVAGYVKEVLTAGPQGIAAAKALIPKIWSTTIDEAMPITAKTIATRRVSPEGQEGMKAFLEKRKPSWSN
jgi:methylglutaconyl-CoA hydratase